MNRKSVYAAAFSLIGAMALAACAAPTPVTVQVTSLVQVTQQVTQEVEVTRQVEVTHDVPVTVAPLPTTAPPATRTLNVQAGGGQETDVISAFLPSAIIIRVGDTLVWKVGGDEIHTVTFNPPPAALAPAIPVPGGGPTDIMLPPELGFATRAANAPIETFDGTGFVTSGIMSTAPGAPDAPPNDTFSLTFSKAGTYTLLCLFHPYMRGTVTVEPANTTGLPEQKDLDAQAKAQTDALTGQVQAAVAANSQSAKAALGSTGNNMWFVTVGMNVGDPSASTYSFGAKDLTVKSGDSVTWFSNLFHTVTFNPTPPPPEFIVPKPQTNGPPWLIINPLIFFPTRPSDVYDPAKYYNSGVIGPGLPNGSTFTLTFDQPGTYEYFCGVHRALGMKGTVTVTK